MLDVADSFITQNGIHLHSVSEFAQTETVHRLDTTNDLKLSSFPILALSPVAVSLKLTFSNDDNCD